MVPAVLPGKPFILTHFTLRTLNQPARHWRDEALDMNDTTPAQIRQSLLMPDHLFYITLYSPSFSTEVTCSMMTQ